MKIAMLPGDGIGTEIVAEAAKVLDGLPIETETAPIGGAGYDAAGQPLPEATLAIAQRAEAVVLGAVGGPKYESLPRHLRPEQGLLAIRKALGTDPTTLSHATAIFNLPAVIIIFARAHSRPGRAV